ncbi:MAG: iron-sulfur cluster assembly scaffold protein [Veillonellaceae bacterium]|nr:iron-sulfur cluster assembly scaffold protein [Veillonellaceae bacterium]
MACADFSDKTIEHFMQPQNVGYMEDADAVGISGEPGCGDSLAIFIKVQDNVITEISFLVFGCVAAVASSSMTTELAKGKTLEEAAKITDADIVAALDGLPEHKLHCSVLGASALQNAIANYRGCFGV